MTTQSEALPSAGSWRRPSRFVGLTLFVLAAVYFAQGITTTLELTDEGCVIYPIWRVAEGAIPYRDFRQLYGPSLFFVNAALLRLFGTDLLVIRYALVLLKALVALLVYLLARRVARWPFALAAYALCVAIWGTPWWMLNSPYASHWAITLSLAALLTFLSLPQRPRTACLLAGLCFGVATTFKQTSGVFGFSSLLLFLACERTTGRGARTIRALVIGGLTSLFIAYLYAHLTSWSTLLLVAPLAATLVTRGPGGRRGISSPTVFASIGMALPLIAYGVFYLSIGSIRAVADNLVYGLPQHITRFVPLPGWGVVRPEWMSSTDPAGPRFRTLMFAVVAVTALASVRLWRQRSSQYRLPLAMCLVAAAALSAELWRNGGIIPYFANGTWVGEVHRLIFWIPLLLVWSSFVTITSPHAAADQQQMPLRLLHFHAAVGLLQLYPAADIWHVLMIVPAYLPLLANGLDRVHGNEAVPTTAFRQRCLSALLCGALLLWLGLPFVKLLIAAREERPAMAAIFSRATGIWDAYSKQTDTAALINQLRESTPPHQPLLVVFSAPGIYFLAGRVSALDSEEYTLYLIGTDLISAAAVHAMLDQAQIIARLEVSRPVVIDRPGSVASARFLAALPAVAAYIRTHYRVAEVIGPYQILKPASG